MIPREKLVAGVLDATDKVVREANAGNWQAAVKSSSDRQALLQQLARQEPTETEHGFLRALRDAAAESDAALKQMMAARADAAQTHPPTTQNPMPSSDGVRGTRICTKA